MPNAIQFLEAVGSNSALSRLSNADFAAAMAGFDISDKQQQALIARDEAKLVDLLGGRSKMLFAIMTPDDDSREELPAREEPTRESPDESPE